MFRDLIRDMDAAVFDTLGDRAWIVGREEPVQGMFSAPWLQPTLGNLNTCIREPHFVLRDEEAALIQKKDVIRIEGETASFEVVSMEPDGSGLTTLVLR